MLGNLARRSVLARRVANRVRSPDPPGEEWFEDHYPEWRRKRIAAITRHYGPCWFAGRSLLEVGCGFADIGAEFAALGASVTASDARPEHLAEARGRHPELIAFELVDLDAGWPFRRDLDLVLHLGVLYHLRDAQRGVRDLLTSQGHIVLETEVVDSSDPRQMASTIESGYDQAVNHRGSRPSPAMIERLLAESGRRFSRITDDSCNDGYHRYDWPVRDTGEWSSGLRRLWFVEPRTRIPSSPWLTRQLNGLLASSHTSVVCGHALRSLLRGKQVRGQHPVRTTARHSEPAMW